MSKDVWELDREFNSKLDKCPLRKAQQTLEYGKDLLRKRDQHSEWAIHRLTVDDPSLSTMFTRKELRKLIAYMD